MVIHKFTLAITDHQTVHIPGLIEVLSVAAQKDNLVLYAVVNTDDTVLTKVEVMIKATGRPMGMLPEDPWRFMGTHLMLNDLLVWHVWSRVNPC